MKNLIYSMIGISIAILYFLIMVIFIIFNKLDYFDIGVISVALIVGVFLIYIILELVIKKKKFNENLVLGIIGFVSIFFIFKSSSSPLYDILKKFDVHVFDKFSVGNDIIFNLSIGILVSIIFYTLTVKFPEYRRKKIIKNNLKKEYDLFRFSVTSEFLKYCMKDNFKKLKYKDVDNMEKFRKYFNDIKIKFLDSKKILKKIEKIKWLIPDRTLTLEDYQYQYNEFYSKFTSTLPLLKRCYLVTIVG